MFKIIVQNNEANTTIINTMNDKKDLIKREKQCLMKFNLKK